MIFLLILLILFHLSFVPFQLVQRSLLACEISRLVVLVVQLWTRLKYLMCPSAERLHYSSFGGFPRNKHLIEFPSSESLASVFNSNSFNRSIRQSLRILASCYFLTFSGVTWNNCLCRFFRYSIVWAFAIRWNWRLSRHTRQFDLTRLFIFFH